MINVHRNVMYFCSVREFSFGESEMVQARLVGCCFCSAREEGGGFDMDGSQK